MIQFVNLWTILTKNHSSHYVPPPVQQQCYCWLNTFCMITHRGLGPPACTAL
jgi:hypothetical protein